MADTAMHVPVSGQPGTVTPTTRQRENAFKLGAASPADENDVAKARAYTIIRIKAADGSPDDSIIGSPGHSAAAHAGSGADAQHALEQAAAAAGVGSTEQLTMSSTAVVTQPQAPQLLQRTERRRTLFHYLFMPLALPLLVVYWWASFLIAVAATFAVVPCVLLAKRLYWACPFIPYVFSHGPMRRRFGWLGSGYMRICLEGAYCMNTVTRMLTLPMRQQLPSFYILGFPKCGTTSLAAHLKRHPAIDGLDCLKFHEALSKESHFLAGVLGRGTTASKALYRSFFPTVIRRWWAEVVLGVDKWMCFDACPIYACLPFAAQRIQALTPDAKLIFMVRDPADGVFSAETMLRNMGCPLQWTLTEPLEEHGTDKRFQEDQEATELWRQLHTLGPNEQLPEQLPSNFYFKLSSYLRCARYADCIEPFLQRFHRDNMMFIDFQEFVQQPEAVVERVLGFVGADPGCFSYQKLPAGMAGAYSGTTLHPSVRAHLSSMFEDSDAALAAVMGRELSWRGGKSKGGNGRHGGPAVGFRADSSSKDVETGG